MEGRQSDQRPARFYIGGKTSHLVLTRNYANLDSGWCVNVCARGIQVCVFLLMFPLVRNQTFHSSFGKSTVYSNRALVNQGQHQMSFYFCSYLTAYCFSLWLSSTAFISLSPPRLSIYLSIFINPTESGPGRGSLHHHVGERESYRLL